MNSPIYVSVDVETAGAYPGAYSLLSIGACDAIQPQRQFSCFLQPDSDAYDPKALAVTGLSLEALKKTGTPAKDAMSTFAAWLNGLGPVDSQRIFVGLNAPFDWAFINHYFLRYEGANPFGFTALDIKAFYMGVTGCSWDETKSSAMARRLSPVSKGDHDALHDALYQAELFRLTRELRGVQD